MTSSAEAFVDCIRTDPALATRLRELSDHGAGGLAELVVLAADLGYTFDAEDLVRTLGSGGAQGELDEADLERVQGGIIAILIGFASPSKRSPELDESFKTIP